MEQKAALFQAPRTSAVPCAWYRGGAVPRGTPVLKKWFAEYLLLCVRTPEHSTVTLSGTVDAPVTKTRAPRCLPSVSRACPLAPPSPLGAG